MWVIRSPTFNPFLAAGENESILQTFAPLSENVAYIPKPISSCPAAGCL